MPSYTVRAGDTLSGIAQANGLGGNYGALGYTGDPHSLQVGTVLNWGGTPSNNSTPSNSAPASGGIAPPDVNAAYAGQNDLVTQTNQQRQALLDKLSGEENQNYSDLTGAISGQETMTDAYSRLRKSLGLDTLETSIQPFKDQIFSTKQILNNLDKDINSRTQGTLTTQAQQDRMHQVEGGKLNDTLSSLGTSLQPLLDAYSTGSNNLTQQLGLEQQDQQKQLQPYQLKIQAFADKAAREISGFDEGTKNLLDSNLAKIQSGVQISEAEWEKTQDAALKEQEYENQYKIAQIQAQASISSAGAGASVSANAQKELAAAQAGFPSWAAYQASLGKAQAGGGIVNSQIPGSGGNFNPKDLSSINDSFFGGTLSVR